MSDILRLMSSTLRFHLDVVQMSRHCFSALLTSVDVVTLSLSSAILSNVAPYVTAMSRHCRFMIYLFQSLSWQCRDIEIIGMTLST